MKKLLLVFCLFIFLVFGYFGWQNKQVSDVNNTESKSQTEVTNIVNVSSNNLDADSIITQSTWSIQKSISHWNNLWKYFDTESWKFLDKIIYSNRNIWNTLVWPQIQKPSDITKYKYLDSYALIYSPLDYKRNYSHFYFPFRSIVWLYSQFTNKELLDKKINTKNTQDLEIEDSIIYWLLNNDKKELITNQDIEKRVENVNWYSIFVESFQEGIYQCMYFLERLDDNYVLQYAWCWEKNVYNTQDIEFIKKSEVKIPTTINHKNFNDTNWNYQTINNTLMFVSFSKLRYPLSDIINNPYGKNTLSCNQMKNYPILKCDNKYFENYDEFSKLYFINSKKFVDNSQMCFQWDFPDTNDENTIDFHCYIDPKSDVIITYDLNGNIIEKKYPKLIKQYYEYIDSWDLDKAYGLKDTTQSLNDFLDIYWDVDELKIISIEEGVNSNYKLIIQIDFDLYSVLINTQNAKIKTLETKKLDTKTIKNWKIIDKSINSLYPDINYHPYLNKTREWSFNQKDRYYIIYFPEGRKDLYNTKIDLFWSENNIIYYSLNITLGEILDWILSKNVQENWVVNIKNTWESEKYYDFDIQSESVSIQKQWDRNIFIETFNNSDTKYYFAERLDENQIILYEWKNKNFISSDKLNEIYSKKEEFRLTDKKNRDCYLHQWNMLCYEKWVEKVKIEHKLSETEVCDLMSPYIIWCKDYSSDFKDFYDLYFLQSWKILYYKDLIIWDIQSWKHNFSYKSNDNWITIIYEKLGKNNVVIHSKNYTYDINWDLLK